MSEKEAVQGLACPRCGGMVPIPEGVAIVRCPYCELRSLVRGERGLRRYQVPQRVTREQAIQAMQGFLSEKKAIARDAASNGVLTEAFIVYLPFWASWARVLGWIFGQKRVRSNDRTEYRPKEVRLAQDLSWSGAACDVGEFGVQTIPLTGQTLEPFNPETLHVQGMVFEPVGSVSDAQAAAQAEFNARIDQAASLDRVSQTFVRSIRQRFGLIYYPLWVLRYTYRGRAYQLVVDGYSGLVLYGKAPGNTLYRAAVLVGGMALGAFMMVDISAAAFAIAFNMEGDGVGIFIVAGLAAIVIGFGLMATGYRRFRYGEQFEYRRDGPKASMDWLQVGKSIAQMGDVQSWINR
jgi:DNA-directed RNA polymerase subunit RPC12/RpoP